MNTLFWMSFLIIFYHYTGYPGLLFFLSKIRRCGLIKKEITPSLSLIIAAYNEERVIQEKLENTLRLDYPEEQIEIIVVADGSNDHTAKIVGNYAAKGIRLLYQPERAGKSAALNRAVPLAGGEIILFSDANTFYQPDILKKLASNFYESSVGGVSGKKIILKKENRQAAEGESLFWGYESFIKEMESRIGSITSADGEVFAIRRSLFEPIPKQIVHDDMYLTLRIIEKGYRVIYEKEAISKEHASKTLIDEFYLKVRYASAGFQILFFFKRFFFRHFFITLSFLSHKVLRWLMPFPLAAMFFSSAFSISPFVRLIFISQCLFYACAIVGALNMKREGLPRLFYFPLYFSMGNYAALFGFLKFLRRGQTSLWRKAER